VLHQSIAHQPITYVGSGSGTARPGRLTDPRTGHYGRVNVPRPSAL
jgi:hypothetical protein